MMYVIGLTVAIPHLLHTQMFLGQFLVIFMALIWGWLMTRLISWAAEWTLPEVLTHEENGVRYEAHFQGTQLRSFVTRRVEE